MTSLENVIEFRVLGPLVARFGDEALPLGGAKQRAVLAALLLRANEVVSIERLIDEVWGDDPPPSAAHSLEVYISRLRRLFGGSPSLARRGRGYVLELREARLDAADFVELAGRASQASAEGDQRTASEFASEALSTWRGPALADVALASAGRAEAERLEELRLHTFELWFEAALALGRHEGLVVELQVLVRQNPYREQFVAQLMLALYRSGRHADALDVYEQTRAALADDLGLQPSLELQQLSAQIVRQEPQLRRPAPTAPRMMRARPIRDKAGRMSGMVLAGALFASTMALTASGSAPQPTPPVLGTAPTRVALVIPEHTIGAPFDPRVNTTAFAFRGSADAWRVEAETLETPEAPSPEAMGRLARRLEAGGFSLVLVWGEGASARALAPLVERLSGTRFVFIGASVETLSLQDLRNATAFQFADEESSHLAGYLSGLAPLRGGSPKLRPDTVTVVAEAPTSHAHRVIQAFTRGVKRARPDAVVQVDYSNEAGDPTACERIANEQIDAGSDVVFALAGRCGLGALAVARTRGVWGIAANEDGAPAGPHMLATTYKDWGAAVRQAMNDFELGVLPAGDVALGLADDYAVGLDLVSYAVPGDIWSKVVARCSEIRSDAAAAAQ